MPLLFLGVDGVLHPAPLQDGEGKVIDEHCFHKSCMTELKRVVDATGAEIVLSSGWRLHERSAERLLKALEPYGLSFTMSTTTGVLDATRAAQILQFVSQAPQTLQPMEWAVVDGKSLFCGSEPDTMIEEVVACRFVKTDGRVGMTAADADKLIYILSGQAKNEGKTHPTFGRQFSL